MPAFALRCWLAFCASEVIFLRCCIKCLVIFIIIIIIMCLVYMHVYV